jgi:hypothetical protein
MSWWYIIFAYELDVQGSLPDRGREFLYITMSILAVRPTQPPVMVWLLSLGIRQPGKLTTHLHLVPKLRMHAAIPPLLCMSSQCDVKLMKNLNYHEIHTTSILSIPYSTNYQDFTAPSPKHLNNIGTTHEGCIKSLQCNNYNFYYWGKQMRQPLQHTSPFWM